MEDDTPSTSPVQDAYAAIMNAITRGATNYEPQMHDSSVVRDLAEAYALITGMAQVRSLELTGRIRSPML